MGGKGRPFTPRRGRQGGAIARLCLGLFGAILLLAAPLCVAQARADDCATMSETMGHGDGPAAHPKADCAISCRLAPQPAPGLEAPLRIAYGIRFETELPGPDGIVVDPPVPPPRRAA